MAIDSKYHVKSSHFFRDVRPIHVRIKDWLNDSENAFVVYVLMALTLLLPLVSDAVPRGHGAWDIILIIAVLYFVWYIKQPYKAPIKMPAYAAPLPDPNNRGFSGKGKSEGILFVGNERKSKKEIWLTNSDARTHILYLGTTGSGKTTGLRGMIANSLCWGSGFVYIDGKADTELWANLYSLCRRFGREDDLLVINYMTANSDDGSASNTMNPFANGSASYLTQTLVSLLSASGGDNAMWKDRAISLVSALLPALTYMRDKMNIPMDIGTVRDRLELKEIVKLSRDKNLPPRVTKGLDSYLKNLPGYQHDAFTDDGELKPPGPDTPVFDMSVANQQHGYLTMQFTRSLQSLADEYRHIFSAQLADIDLMDVVLQRRILVVMIPALEKSGDEAANLGKIVTACLKGMMGATLGADVEGDFGEVIENKSTNSNSPFMALFDEVGYYATEGMAVMAAQARSLGFSLVFSAQDLPAMEKRVKEEARSITGNCNLKIFGKLEDPTTTAEFFEKSLTSVNVFQEKSMNTKAESITGSWSTTNSAGIESKKLSNYEALKEQREGEAVLLFGQHTIDGDIFGAIPEKSKALRVQKFLPVPGVNEKTQARSNQIADIASKLNDANWTAASAGVTADLADELGAAVTSFKAAQAAGNTDFNAALIAVSQLPATNGAVDALPTTEDKPVAAAAISAAKAPAAPPKAPAKPAQVVADVKPQVEQTTVRRAATAVTAPPSEQEIARMAAQAGNSATASPADFALAEPDEALAKKLKNIAGTIEDKLFAERAE